MRTYVFSLTSSKGCLHKLYGIRKAEEFRLNSPKVVRLTLQVSFAAWPMISVTWTFIWSPRSEKAAFIPIRLCLVFGCLETAVILCFMQKPIDFRKHWRISCNYLIDWKWIPSYEEFTMRKHISRAGQSVFVSRLYASGGQMLANQKVTTLENLAIWLGSPTSCKRGGDCKQLTSEL